MGSVNMKNIGACGSRLELDPVAQYYAATINDTCPGTFNVSARLKEMVNPEILQKAVNDLIRRLPFLSGQLRSGFFRHYIELLDSPPQIVPSKDVTSFGRCHKKGRDNLLKVLYGERHFTVETTHIVCDGRSLAKIVSALLVRYFGLSGVSIDKSEVIDCSGQMRPEETEDAFTSHISNIDPKEAQDIFKRYVATQSKNKPKEAYRFGDSHPAASRIVSKQFDAAKIKATAKEHGATVSEFILAHIFMAIAEERKNHKSKKPIAVMLPIDYRTFFPHETLTNFAMGKVILMPETEDFSEILRQIKWQFEEINASYASDDIIGFAKVSRLMRFIPLLIKKRLLKAMKRSIADGFTSTFSNLGFVRLPAEIEERIETLEFAFCPDTEQESYAFSCITIGNALMLSAAIAVEGADATDKLMQTLDKLHSSP